jgi:hypothetical protein
MHIEIFRIEGRACLLISPSESVAERLASAMENSEVVAALGAYLPLARPVGELVGLYSADNLVLRS